MAQLNYNVDTTQLEESFDVVPAGTYLAVIEDSDYAENKQGTGKILSLKYQIIDGPLKGRKLFENLNIENKSPQAEIIARKALNSIGLAVGVLQVKDSADLHNIPFYIDVKVKESEKYGMQNSISKHTAKGQPVSAPKPAANGSANVGMTDNPGTGARKKMSWEK